MSQKQNWRQKRVKLVRQVYRLDINILARSLWAELALNWCWDSPNCFPSQNVLAVGLSIHPNTISKLMIELVELGLMTRTRVFRGYRISLATAIPDPLLVDEWRFDNRKLTQRVKKAPRKQPKNHDAVRSNPLKEGVRKGVQITFGVIAKSHLKGLTPKSITPNVIVKPHLEGLDVSLLKESLLKEKEKQYKFKRVRSKTSERLSSKKDFVGSMKNQGTDSAESDSTANEKQTTYDEEEAHVLGPSDFMEDSLPLKTQHQKNKRRSNGPSSDLVSIPGHGLRTASEPPEGTETVQPGPPALKQPQDVLALLRGEIEEKYGSRSCVSIPLQLSGKEKSQLRNVILGRYAPSVVIGMIRVLVWDWEVARTSCFPFRRQSPIPTVEALVQYQETLASAVTTGLKYDGSRRGAWNTYSSRYLKNDLVGDILPF